MKFRLTVLIVFSLCLSNVFADEGMWLLGNLRKNKQTDPGNERTWFANACE